MQRRSSAIAAALLAMATLIQPAAAFSDLIRFAALIADNPPSPYVFDYTAPLGGFAPDSATAFDPSDRPLAGALVASAGLDPATGVDFGKVSAVFTTGEPPRVVTVLIGEPGFATGAAPALTARDFAASELEGYPVFARGDDYALDLAAAHDPDPFGSGMGKSQRLAIGDDFILRAAGWPEFDAALAALPRPSMQANLWAAIVEGLRNSSGDESHLDIASGWLATAFLDVGPDLDLLADPSSIGKTKIKPGFSAKLAVFPMAVFAVTQTPTTASVQIALPFGDGRQAQFAAEEIAERLVRHPFTPSTPRIEVQFADPFSIAVLSIDMPAAEASAARDLYARWMVDIQQRNFPPLEIDF